MHNALIEQRDTAVGGNLRKLARLLKCVKYDADTNVDISSYDITSIAYRIPFSTNSWALGTEKSYRCTENAKLSCNFYWTLLITAPLCVCPTKCVQYSGGQGASIEGLRQLHKEVQDLVGDVNRDLARSLRKLTEARVSY